MKRIKVLFYRSETKMFQSIVNHIARAQESDLSYVLFTSDKDWYDIRYVGMLRPNWYGEMEGIMISSREYEPIIYAFWDVEPESEIEETDRRILDNIMDAISMTPPID